MNRCTRGGDTDGELTRSSTSIDGLHYFGGIEGLLNTGHLSDSLFLQLVDGGSVYSSLSSKPLARISLNSGDYWGRYRRQRSEFRDCEAGART